jgi:hypothetical protein
MLPCFHAHTLYTLPPAVMVYATLTDVLVVKLAKRLIRFVPAATVLADPAAQASSGASGGVPSFSSSAAAEVSPRCQVRAGRSA